MNNGQYKMKTTDCRLGLKKQSVGVALFDMRSGADHLEHATPILSLCHGIFTD